ncbi:MAG: hypothetical protein GY793_02900 [Proteobacteria bacterium]|nr:hypothetical protein [Pseudomonadota bacterium]
MKKIFNAVIARYKNRKSLSSNFEKGSLREFCGKYNAFADLLETPKLKVVRKKP